MYYNVYIITIIIRYSSIKIINEQFEEFSLKSSNDDVGNF